jgi:hypothetical protein
MVDVARTLPMIWAPLLASLRISMRVESEGEVKIAERREAEAEGSDAWEMTAGQRKSPRSVSKEDRVAKRSGEERREADILRRTVKLASLCVHKWATWGAKRFASSPYLPGKLDWSTSHVKSNAPFGLVDSGMALRIIPPEMRF